MIHTDEDDEFARIERENSMKGQPYNWEANAIQAAIRMEREACAKVCELMWHEWLDSPEENEPNKPDAEDCYRAIRARSNP